MKPMLDIDRLSVKLRHPATGHLVPVLDQVSLSVGNGESIGLVGESGSGKSMTTRAVMHLLPDGAVRSGSVCYKGREIADFDRKELAHYRNHSIGVIFQDPRAHINPLWKIGDFLTEAVVANRQMTLPDATEQAVKLLGEVGVTNGRQRMGQYPHELSGGLLQRVMIVSALMPSPELILADEISTALDVSVQSEVMAILSELRETRHLAMLFITHDLDLAAAVNDRLAIMYAGSIMEIGPSAAVCEAPRHPYTAALMASRPSLTEVRRLQTIPGRPIAAYEAGAGCLFASRCTFATPRCKDERPALVASGDRHVACHFADDLTSELAKAVTA
jgi:peptide/nickel transport system ATP-binding protein